MSDNILTLIPVNETYLPAQTAQKEASTILASFLQGDREVHIRITEQVEFIDSGENFETIFCPACNTQISDLWWQQAMDTAHQSQFTDLMIVTPCCQSTVSLNNLIYRWPAGFARFALVVHDPQNDISEEEMESIAEILGCQLREIWRRY